MVLSAAAVLFVAGAWALVEGLASEQVDEVEYFFTWDDTYASVTDVSVPSEEFVYVEVSGVRTVDPGLGLLSVAGIVLLAAGLVVCSLAYLAWEHERRDRWAALPRR